MAIEYYSPVDINGNLTLTAGGPKLTLVDSTDDDDQQILFTNSSGTVDYRIHTSDFTGAGGGDGMYIGSTQSDGEVCLVTHDTIALTLDTSQNATFAGDITCGDDLFMPSAGVINFNSGDVTITHSSNQLAVSGGNLLFNFAGSNYNTADGTAFLDSEDNDLITFGEQAVTFSSTNVSIGGTLNVAGDIVHTGDTDTKIGFSTNSVRFTVGNVVTATHSTTGINMPLRDMPKTGTTDGDVNGDVIYIGNTGTTVGKIYHFKSDATWEEVDANEAAKCDGMLAVALGSNSTTNGMLLRGMITLNHDPGALGDVLFASAAATGQATGTAPSGNGDIVRVIGYLLDADNGQIYFNPDGTFVEVTA
jgi:hypothetical protein